jgi:uncharacterized protein YfiM (DUF2279 family)
MRRLLTAILLLAAISLAPARLSSQGAADYPFRNAALTLKTSIAITP